DPEYRSLWKLWDPWAFIPENYNLGMALTYGQVVAGLGDRTALHWENASGQSGSYTYNQLHAASNRLAFSLKRLGIDRGDRLFLRLPNLPEFYISALAVAKLGAIFIPSSTQFHEAEVRYRLKDAAAVAAITTPRLSDAIEKVRGQCPDLKHLISVAGTGGPA